jgi:hypothetical protein
MATFAVEVPFLSDLAPFKVIRTGDSGKRRIVDAAQTPEAAEAKLQKWVKLEARWDEPLDNLSNKAHIA